MNSLTNSLAAVFSETGTLPSLTGYEFLPQENWYFSLLDRQSDTRKKGIP